MHTIEPYFNWRNLYIASEDEKSPFYKYTNNEAFYSHAVYNYYIHPQWDFFDAATLFCKILFADYSKKFVIIELMGEWNDCTHLDIKYFKRNVLDKLLDEGINNFILIGENVYNFFATTDGYYEEWYEELEGGWIFAINFHQHVINEIKNFNLHFYFTIDEDMIFENWRTFTPFELYTKISKTFQKEGILEIREKNR